MMRWLFLCMALICLMSTDSKAQDPHFSQFYNTPMQLSPAMTGVFNGKYRFGAAYRDQWSSILSTLSFKTVQASFDIKYRFRQSDFFAFGVNIMNDEVGNGRFRHTLGQLNGAYHMQIGGSKYTSAKQFLVAGLQAGFGQNTLDWNRLWFGRQYNVASSTIEDSSQSGEGNLGALETNIFLDLGLGVLWYMLLDESNSVYGGLAVNHINNPDISLIGNGSDPLHRKFTLHGGGEIFMTREWSVLPSMALMFQGPSFQANFGSNFRYVHPNWRDIALRVGSFLRVAKTTDGYHADAIIMTTMLEFGRFHWGLSYDVTSSDLAPANSRRGAFETTVTYVAPMGERKMQIVCPKI